MYTGGACEDLHAVSLRLRVVQVSLVQEGFSRKTFLCSCLAVLADYESIMSGLSRIVRPDVHFVVQASLEQCLVRGRHFRAPVEWALREARLRPFSSSAPCWSTCGRSFRGEYGRPGVFQDSGHLFHLCVKLDAHSVHFFLSAAGPVRQERFSDGEGHQRL